MADIFALDVSMGKSYCVWYRGKHCLKEFSLVHTKAEFNALQDMIKKAQKPIIYFEATGIYSRVIEHFCETNGLRFCRLNP
ncbi:IS110 family transposase, partial [Limosilactobacillus balticus]|nr:IS110 family transposase [Limosilactobacillus balticus]